MYNGFVRNKPSHCFVEKYRFVLISKINQSDVFSMCSNSHCVLTVRVLESLHTFCDDEFITTHRKTEMETEQK